MIIYLGLYTLFLSIIWWFFIIIKLNTIKLSYFINNFKKITNFIFLILIFLSLLWYIIIFYNLNNDTVYIKDYKNNYKNEVTY